MGNAKESNLSKYSLCTSASPSLVRDVTQSSILRLSIYIRCMLRRQRHACFIVIASYHITFLNTLLKPRAGNADFVRMSNFVDDERFDGMYLNVASTTKGIEPLLDTVFSFCKSVRWHLLKFIPLGKSFFVNEM